MARSALARVFSRLQVPLKVTLDGVASFPPRTVFDILKHTAEVCVLWHLLTFQKFAHRDALCVKRGGRWVSWTYEQVIFLPF